MTARRVLGLSALFFVLLGLADYATLAGTAMAETTFDSGIFLRCSRKSLFDAGFYAAVRPPTVPFLYKLSGGDPNSIRVLHSALSVICWGSLGLVLASLFRGTPLRVVVAIGVGALSLTSPINQWDGVMMSESIFLSLMVATIAMTIVAGRELVDTGQLSLSKAIAWILISALFVGSRDSAVYFFALAWGAGTIWLLTQRRVRQADDDSETKHSLTGVLTALALGLALLIGTQVSLHKSGRWHTPLVNVILKRVLPDTELYDSWVERYDLPRNAIFEGQSGQFAWNRIPDGIQLRKLLTASSKLSDVEVWLQNRGVSSYQRHLVWDEPLRSLGDAATGFVSGVNPSPPVGPGEREASYSEGAGITGWSQSLTSALYAPIPASLWIAIVVGIGGVLLVLFRPESRVAGLCLVWLIGGALTQGFITWHGDTAEVARHTLVVGVLMRLALGVALATLIDLWRNR